VAGNEPTAQRAWRSACPNCGAPVEFRSAGSASAVCSFCRSTLVRDGEVLQRIGQSAELFDDHSPLQLGAAGKRQGLTFTLVGRLQYAYAEGTWNEWYVLFDNGRGGWLSEDNGAYVLAFDAELPGPAPELAQLRAGQRVMVGSAAWDVASVVVTHLIAAQGELPHAPRLQGDFTVADLRNAQGEVGTLDYSDARQVQWSLGRSTTLAELAMTGLRESSEKTLGAQGVNCPQCGAAIELKLATTQSISCQQCHSLVDVSQGAGAGLAHVTQPPRSPSGRLPKIALGSTGRLAIVSPDVLDWQCVGYVERCDIPEEAGESPTYWSEYLLFHRTAGFAFLVDGEDGWSAVRTLTGAPEVRGQQARWQGERYDQRYTYGARVTWVEGEFYWRVQRDEQARVTDYVGTGGAKGRLLSREQTGNEVTWSGGSTLRSEERRVGKECRRLCRSRWSPYH
jgi:hypothetical protein